MNHVNTALLIALAIASVSCNDIQVGTDHGRIVLNETVQASPHFFWKQVQRITVNVSDQEVISSIMVKDNRPDKDGEAEIVEGGEGQKNVTIQLKSPTLLRGFDFQVTVYAAQEIQHPGMTSDIDVNASAQPENPDNVLTVDSTVNKLPNVPVLTGSQPRSINQTVDPIIKYVTTDQLTTKVADVDLKTNHHRAVPVTPASEVEITTRATEETATSEQNLIT